MNLSKFLIVLFGFFSTLVHAGDEKKKIADCGEVKLERENNLIYFTYQKSDMTRISWLPFDDIVLKLRDGHPGRFDESEYITEVRGIFNSCLFAAGNQTIMDCGWGTVTHVRATQLITNFGYQSRYVDVGALSLEMTLETTKVERSSARTAGMREFDLNVTLGSRSDKVFHETIFQQSADHCHLVPN